MPSLHTVNEAILRYTAGIVGSALKLNQCSFLRRRVGEKIQSPGRAKLAGVGGQEDQLAAEGWQAPTGPTA